jgi:superfamily II DNA/RNA helicase
MELHPLALAAMTRMGIEQLNDMQLAALQAIPAETDTKLLAPTGSGKTLGFLLPILQLIQPDTQGVQVLIIAPTRELAIQIERVWQQMGTGYKVSTCYGGHPMPVEVNNLLEPPALLIGTPGRLLDHLARPSFDPLTVHTLVLDEFDKSLSLGFQEQMTEVIGALKQLQRRVLVSATGNLRAPDFTGIKHPKTLNFTRQQLPVQEGFTLHSVAYNETDKQETLFNLLCALGSDSTLVFCNQRDSTEQLYDYLGRKGLDVGYFHGGLDQLEREKALIRFRNGSTTFFISSDLAARGLDIPDVRNVVHAELPMKNNDFVHRNGRTARMHAEGRAFVLLGATEALPDYLSERPAPFALPAKAILPPRSPWTTLYISGGKKDKLSKVDIVGFLGQKGQLPKNEIGKIEVLDFMTFVAIHESALKKVLSLIQNEKIKGKKYKINAAW